jgi:hypothetical protein
VSELPVDPASSATTSLRPAPSLRSPRDSTSTLQIPSPSTESTRHQTYYHPWGEKQAARELNGSLALVQLIPTADSIYGPEEAVEEPHKIGTVVAVSTRSGLHYGIFLIEDPGYRIRNRIRLPTLSPNGISWLYPEAVATDVQEGVVYVASGKSGVIRGTIIRNPYFIKLAGSEDCQKMWPIQLERDIGKSHLFDEQARAK